MSTPKKSTLNHAMTGTYRRDRHRQRTPDSGGIGAAPGHLDDALAATWRELVSALPVGIGGKNDRISFELLTRLAARMRDGHLTAAEVSRLHELHDRFGPTPAGRERLDAVPPAPEPKRPKTGLASFRNPHGDFDT